MVIREIGILLYGMPILYKSYHQASKKEGLITKSAFISSILTFAEKLIAPIHYFESEKYLIVFNKGKIRSRRSKDKEMIIAYVVMDKEKKIDKTINNRIFPLLESVLDEFIQQYEGKDLNELSQYAPFTLTIDKILGTDTKTFEEKASSLFFGD